MDPKVSGRIMRALSVAYGLTVGILAVADSPAMAIFATVGAMVLGALWVMRGIFLKRESDA
jgi:hypothetical protein